MIGTVAAAWARAWPWRTGLVAAAALVLYLVAGPAAAPLVLAVDPATWLHQPWTLLTGHLIHAGPTHLQWDLLGLMLVGFVYEPLLRERLWPVLLGGALAIAIGLAAGLGGAWLVHYCGLSGIINAVVGAGALAAWRRGDGAAVAFALLVIAKVTIEVLGGGALLTTTAWPPVPIAHLLGMGGGAAALLIPALRRRPRPSREAAPNGNDREQFG